MNPTCVRGNPYSAQRGSALGLALIALALLSVIGLWIGLSSASEIQIGSNYEAEIRARYASLAGINHAREALRGVDFSEILRGPDGVADLSAASLAFARTTAFRNPVTMAQARELDLSDPSRDLAAARDDGIIHSGRVARGAAIAIVPLVGLPIPSVAGAGPVRARYFVKVSDNNGEPSETAGDASDNPFVDGDATVLVRSVGCAGNLREPLGATARRNAVIVTEARFRRRATFDLEAPLVIQGTRVVPAGAAIFSGNTFRIAGGPGHPGVGVVDPEPEDGLSPLEDLLLSLDPGAADRVEGGGLAPPAVADVSQAVSAHPEKSLRLNRRWMWSFAHESAPRISDSSLTLDGGRGDATPANLGTFDPALLPGDPAQDPRLTFVDGDLAVDGDLRGAGLLVVTGNLLVSGRLEYYGLILIIGGGGVTAAGGGLALTGALLVSPLRTAGEGLAWGEAAVNIGGGSTLLYDRGAVAMAITLIPPAQLGIREVTRSMDP